MKTILVTLSGTHGTGKSTNAGRCYYLLNRAGLRFSYLRHQDILDPFGFILRRTARILRYKNPSDLQKTRPMAVLWSVYLLLIYIPVLVGGIKLRRFFGYSVVCDRYVYDLLVGFWGDDVKIPIEHLLVWVMPHPDVSFVLDAELSRILEDRPEHTSKYIRMEKQLYDSAAQRFSLMRVSTNDPPLRVWDTMFRAIQSALGVNLPSS